MVRNADDISFSIHLGILSTTKKHILQPLVFCRIGAEVVIPSASAIPQDMLLGYVAGAKSKIENWIHGIFIGNLKLFED